MSSDLDKTPAWVWAILIALAMAQPLLLVWIISAPFQGLVPTGLHIPDSALFLYSMEMFTSGFHSDYATCNAPEGNASLRYYAVPHLWLYGLLGLLNRLLPIPAFFLYGLANGLGFALYLYAVYRFLQVTARQYANRAFLFFTFTSGPAGGLYLAAVALGLTEDPGFPRYFDRFALYTLFEGPHLNPVLYAPRFYYTLSLAGLFAAATLVLAKERLRPRDTIIVALLCASSAFINARFGVFTCAIVAMALTLQADRGRSLQLRAFISFAAPTAAGCGASALLMRLNPGVIQNHMGAGAMAMWFSPFVAAAIFHLLLAAPLWRNALRQSAGWPRMWRALTGYLAVYTAACLIYQAYYGNLLTGRDSAVAAAVSDWALLGLLAGLWPRRRTGAPLDGPAPFFLTWFLIFLCVSISGWGQGWFLRFGPQRLEPLIWLPLCTLAAAALPKFTAATQRRIVTGLLIVGVPGVCVATLVFQAPPGAPGSYREYTPFLMSSEDDAAMRAMPSGRVLAPPPASDIIALRHHRPVVFGIGSFNLTDGDYHTLRDDVAHFFSPDATESERSAMIAEYCVEIVYCPATWPVDPDVMRELGAYPWLSVVQKISGGAVFSVQP